MVAIQFYRSVCYALALLIPASLSSINFKPDAGFQNYHLTFPKVYHAIHKKEISSSKETENQLKHLNHLTVIINLHGEDRILDLKLNRDLISKTYFEKHQGDDGYVVKRPLSKDVELCHYNGHIREMPNSWAAVSTCNGLRGMVYDGNEVFYIERASVRNFTHPLNGMHVVYKHSDLQSNFSCGGHDSSSHFANFQNVNLNARNRRVRRSTGTIHDPYNANRLSRYLELVFVVDTTVYKAFNEDMSLVHQHLKDIANIINSLYVPLNIFVALVGVVIWTKHDEITMDKNGDKTLTNFLIYRKEKLVREHPNDNAQLLTKVQFEKGVVGKALKGPICTYEFSGGVNMDHSDVVGLVATTITHEIGHNFGMEHDDYSNCECPSERCIMAPSSSSFVPTEWSSCSREYLTSAFEHGMDYCLRNKPTSLFEGPVCGNDFVEPGEQCDCGLKEKCDNPCCNPSTCMLHTNASCATGTCCDFQTCKPRTAGYECRSAEHECDLPEYCSGDSEYCPDDVFKIDGESCAAGKAYCYQGNCRTHGDQCRILWGPSGMNSDMACYNANTQGNHNGNCGYNRVNKSFVKCEVRNTYCGMLQCYHLNEKLEFGMESVSILSHSFIHGENGTSIISCRTVLVDLGLNEIDPGLVPDGAKCAENHMCLNQTCMSINEFRALTVLNECPGNCNGNGICNSKGHCHCSKGFAPPFCKSSGVGGSIDSGPAEDPRTYNIFRQLLFYMMLSLVPIVLLLVTYSYYIRRSPSYFWKRNQRRTIQKSVQVLVNHDDHCGGGFNSTVQSLLSNNTTQPAKANEEAVKSSLRNNLIGNFKGFSITPISNNVPNSNETHPPGKLQPVRPAPPPVQSIPVATIKPMMSSSVKVSSTSAINPSASTQQTSNATVCRPIISSPVLDKTTSNTVNQLINKNLPVRPAPPVPIAKIDELNSALSISEITPETSPTTNKPYPKEANSTFNRIASYVYKPTVQPAKTDSNKDSGMPLKATKIDRNTLKSLVISDPIPLTEPTIPMNPLPLSKDQEKSVVMRAQSLRQYGNKKRSATPSFGSVRLSHSQRPTSISCSRPTSPPPCPPAPPVTSIPSNKILTVEYSNLKKEPDTESEDNIYSVIEENPPIEESTITPRNSFLSSKKTAFLEESSDGLLNEIVNEIQARNINSIYSNNDKIDDRLYENTLKSGGEKETQLRKDGERSASASPDYLKPVTPPVNELKKIETKCYPSPMKVPEKSAPSYKPFNSTNKKPIMPITSSFKTPIMSSSEKEGAKLSISESKNQSNANSSQGKSAGGDMGAKSASSISSAVNRATTAKTHLATKPAVASIKPRVPLKTKAAVSQNLPSIGGDKGQAGIPKTSTVASIQKKFEAQSKGLPPSSGAK